MMSRVSGESDGASLDPAKRLLDVRAAARLERPPGAGADEQTRRGLRIAPVEVEGEVGEEVVAGAVGAVELGLVGAETRRPARGCGSGW